MSNSALQTLDDPKKHLKYIKNGLLKFDDLLQENFKLKKEMAFEKKRYIDLTEAVSELKEGHRMQEAEERDIMQALEQQVNLETPGKNSDKKLSREWALQKRQLQETIQAISGEVDYLTTKNNEYLTDLQSKEPFYDSYRAALDELNQLREAHGILISMIKNHHIQVKDEGRDQAATQAIREVTKTHNNSRGGFGPKLAQDPYAKVNFSHFLTCGVYGNRSLLTEEDQRPIARKRMNPGGMI